jgi:hypothetical protein
LKSDLRGLRIEIPNNTPKGSNAIELIADHRNDRLTWLLSKVFRSTT